MLSPFRVILIGNRVVTINHTLCTVYRVDFDQQLSVFLFYFQESRLIFQYFAFVNVMVRVQFWGIIVNPLLNSKTLEIGLQLVKSPIDICLTLYRNLLYSRRSPNHLALGTDPGKYLGILNSRNFLFRPIVSKNTTRI